MVISSQRRILNILQIRVICSQGMIKRIAMKMGIKKMIKRREGIEAKIVRIYTAVKLEEQVVLLRMLRKHKKKSKNKRLFR